MNVMYTRGGKDRKAEEVSLGLLFFRPIKLIMPLSAMHYYVLIYVTSVLITFITSAPSTTLEDETVSLVGWRSKRLQLFPTP
jgi:hypothetical protein